MDETSTDLVSSVQDADSLDLIERMVEIETAWERRNGWPDDPMYDPQLDERLWPKRAEAANEESRC